MNNNNPPPAGTTIFVGNLPFNVNEADLTDVFSQFGNIMELRLVRDKNTGNSKGFAFVQFENACDAKKAKETDM